MTPLEKVQRARTALVIDQPFFGVLSLRLRLIEEARIPMMATDGTHLLFNPAFVDEIAPSSIVTDARGCAQLNTDGTPREKCDMSQLMGVVAHEVMHCAAGHPWRRDQREKLRFNFACDFAINYVLADAGFTLPKGVLRAKKFDGKWAEWIYDRIETQTVTLQMPGCGAPDVMDPSQQGTAPPHDGDGAGAEGPLTEADWQQSVQQVAAAEKARGTLPANLERFCGLLSEPRVDWRSVLSRFIQSAVRADYRWTAPSSRFLAHGLYMPEMRTEAMGPIAVAVDTSGSIDGVLLQQFASELNAIIREVQPERVHVAYCDAAIQRVDVFERGDTLELRAKGGGGTAFEPVMAWVRELDDEPACLVYLTDMEGSFGEAPDLPVLWATPSACHEAPYGEVVRLS